MGLGFDYVLRTVLYLYTYLVVQCNTRIFIGRQHVLLALINKSMVDFKIAFFILKELLIKSWRKAIIKTQLSSQRTFIAC